MTGNNYGSRHRKNRDAILNQPGPLYCWICGLEINRDLPRTDPQSLEIDHVLPVSTHPELRFDLANVRPCCKQCNRSRGNGAPAPGITRSSRDWSRPRKDVP